MRDLAIRRGWRRERALQPSGEASAVPPARLDRARGRLMATGVVFLLCFGALVLRTLDVAVIGAPDGSTGASVGTATDRVARADIVDRNGVLLASNLPTHALYVEPRKILDREAAVAALGAVFPDLDVKRAAVLVASERKTALLRHDLTPEQAHAINRLGIPGLWMERQEQRFYPQGRLFAHAVGFTDVDNRGLAGIEKAAGDELRRRGADDGGPLSLSLDIRVQHALAEALESTMTAHRAIGAAGIVMDVENGEILGLVSLPSFNPKAPDQSGTNARFNRATLGTYELGSTFKPFTVAMALELGRRRNGGQLRRHRAAQGLAPLDPRPPPGKPLADRAGDPDPLLQHRRGADGGRGGSGASEGVPRCARHVRAGAAGDARARPADCAKALAQTHNDDGRLRPRDRGDAASSDRELRRDGQWRRHGDANSAAA